jgi:hypothetical protein
MRIMGLIAATALLVALSAPVTRADDLLGALARPLEGRSRRESSTFRKGADGRYDPKAPPLSTRAEESNFDNFRVAPGETRVLMDARGPGVITHLWLTFLGPEPQAWAKNGSANHQEMLLRMTWDNGKQPAVEVPLGDFFAGCFGKRAEVLSQPVAVEDGDSYNCFWRMPFRKSAKIEIVNQSSKPISLLYYNIDWIELPRLPKDTPYFYARYRQEYPARSGTDYVLLDTKGKGHYVGTVLAVRTRSPAWFGEGDERIYIDGEAVPSIQGTGTEDYFLSAWGLKKASTLYFGVPTFDGWGLVGGHTSAYRWHLADPIVFQKGIRVTFEHFGWISPDENPSYESTSWNEREDDIASVAFWYQTGTPPPFEPVPAVRRLPSLERAVAYARDGGAHGPGEAVAQPLDLYDGPQRLYMPERPDGAFLEVPLTVAKKEPLRLVLVLTKSYDFGRYQAFLDGVKLGEPIDLFSPEVVSAEVPLLDFWPEPGKHVLRLECVDKNPQSRGHYLGIESVRLRERRPRVAAYGHDRDKDWRKAPILYR